jgi:transcriptional regulator with XRE-family HTH domain
MSEYLECATFGAWLSARVKAKGWTTQQFAEEISKLLDEPVSDKLVNHWMTGRRPGRGYVAPLLKLFKIRRKDPEVAHLLGLLGEPLDMGEVVVRRKRRTTTRAEAAAG